MDGLLPAVCHGVFVVRFSFDDGDKVVVDTCIEERPLQVSISCGHFALLKIRSIHCGQMVLLWPSLGLHPSIHLGGVFALPRTDALFQNLLQVSWPSRQILLPVCTVLGMSTPQRIGNTSDWYEICLLTDLYKQENGLSSHAPFLSKTLLPTRMQENKRHT